MILKKNTCPNCGTDVKPRAKFCRNCGTSLAGGTTVCGGCGEKNRGDARFCKGCDRELAESAAPDIYRHRWVRRENDFAARVEAEDLPGILKRGLIVDMGLNAVLVQKGAVIGTVAPGEYNLDSLGGLLKEWFKGRIPESITALLVEVTPTELVFHLGGIFTSDPLRIGATIRLQAQVEHPGKFMANLLKARERLSKEDLRQYLYPEVAQAAERWVRQYTVEQLADDLSLKEKFELALDEALRDTFSQNGLEFLNVRVMELNLEHIDRIKGIKSQYALQVSEAEAEAEGRERLVDAQKELDLAEIAEEIQKVETEERRVELYQRMRQAVMSDRMNEVSSVAEFEEFLNDIDYDKLLREKERDDLLRTWAEEAEDHAKARAHLLAKLEVEQTYELRIIEFRLRSDLTMKEEEFKLELERKRSEQEYVLKAQEWEFELEKKHAFEEHERKKRQWEHEYFVNTTPELMDLAKRAQEELMWPQQEHKMRLRFDEREHELKMHLDKLRAENEIQIRKEQIRHELEFQRLDRLAEMGVEALIAVSDAEQGRIIADLKRTEIMKDKDEGEILAMVAERSPDVAKAMEEKFRAIAEGHASEREREMYEKLLAEKEASERATIEAWDKASMRAKETTERAMDRMAETAQAFAKGPGGTPVVITGTGEGGAQVISTDGAPQEHTPQKDCPTCALPVSIDAKFCDHCGHKFEGV